MVKIITINISFILFFAPLSSEVFLRFFPQYMPYSNTWNYVHHYIDISGIFDDPNGLRPYKPALVLVGDSFTRGAEVPPGRDWPSILKNEYGYNLFNLSVGGSSTVEQMVLIQNVPLPDTVNTVLLVVYENDIRANISDISRYKSDGVIPFLSRASKVSDVSRYKECEVNSWHADLECWYYHSYFYSSLRNIWWQWTQTGGFQKVIDIEKSRLVFDEVSKTYVSKTIDLSNFHKEKLFLNSYGDGLDITASIISVMRDYLKKFGIRLVVAYLPAADEVYSVDWGKRHGLSIDPSLTVGRYLGKKLSHFKIPFFDATELFRTIRKSEAPLYLKFDLHPSENGHLQISEWAESILRREGIRP